MTSTPVFIAHYEISGPHLDVDKLLPEVVHREGSDVWHLGDVTEFGPYPASGFRLPIYEGDSVTELDSAIVAFMQREELLLRTAYRLVGSVRGWDTQCELSTSVFVETGEPPVRVTFSPNLLGIAARMGIPLNVLAFHWERKDAT